MGKPDRLDGKVDAIIVVDGGHPDGQELPVSVAPGLRRQRARREQMAIEKPGGMPEEFGFAIALLEDVEQSINAQLPGIRSGRAGLTIAQAAPSAAFPPHREIDI